MADEPGGKYRKLTHTVYQCNYHIVWVPKYRYRVLEGPIKEAVEHDTRMLCEWKEVEVIELSVQPDHVHLVCSIPPKLAVSEFMGFLKGKLAIKIFKSYPRLKKKPYWGKRFPGQRLLCKHSRGGRRFDPSVCSLPRGRGKKARASAGWLRLVFVRERSPFRGRLSE